MHNFAFNTFSKLFSLFPSLFEIKTEGALDLPQT